MIVPPSACGTPELLGCKSCLVPIIVRVQGELGLDGSEPAICFQWLIRLMEERWLGVQKLLIPRTQGQLAGGDAHAAALCLAQQSPGGVQSARHVR